MQCEGFHQPQVCYVCELWIYESKKLQIEFFKNYFNFNLRWCWVDNSVPDAKLLKSISQPDNASITTKKSLGWHWAILLLWEQIDKNCGEISLRGGGWGPKTSKNYYIEESRWTLPGLRSYSDFDSAASLWLWLGLRLPKKVPSGQNSDTEQPPFLIKSTEKLSPRSDKILM